MKFDQRFCERMSKRLALDDSDDDDDGKKKKDKEKNNQPPPLYPPLRELPPLPTIDSHSYTLFSKLIQFKQRFKYSPYHLKSNDRVKDSIERYSNKYKQDTQNQSIENVIPIHLGYFPLELTTSKRRGKKKAKSNVMKTLEEMEKEEGEGDEDEEKKNEDGEEDSDNEDESDMENDEYNNHGEPDDDDDGDESDGGDEGAF
ncbi:hypothetical protein PPL_04149 [Heterostelium album PN500]|uniref:DNA-directed RNA polymerase III subunit n=1 Tax=Heterostelium pallidum (strain ATCC 26659 / Pp 5 / PN500) TaxID=670386 RepID=D3B658_HETP5|nr:hypothetical protein PPL_04149 [Heterostelium album PN500]EFA83356.1 hypothetical protein PPL_04149 [Heterostelium album PN500]|eukprot:XP_020435473.1 hypothetical protein PPL_04149 [Heterostelium album PN500]